MHSCCRAHDDGCKPTLEFQVFFLVLFHQVMLVGHALGLTVDPGEGGLGAETLPGPP
jgi:hypothetical protein